MHAELLKPSGAAQWVMCPAAPTMQQGLVDDSETAREGTAVHEINRIKLTDINYTGHSFLNTEVEGVIVTQEMIERGKIYIDYIDAIITDGVHHAIEKTTPCQPIHPECFGTPDYWQYDQVEKILTVVDYKDGFLDVSPVENWQLITYAAGIIHNHFQDQENYIRVRFVIVQPRAYNAPSVIRKWNIHATELRPYVNQLHNAANLVMFPNPECKTGEQCRYCLAAFNCPALDQASNVLSVACTSTPDAINRDLSTELSWLSHAMDIIKYRKEAIEAKAFEMIKHGESVPGFEIGTTRGSTTWNDKPGVEDVAAMMGVDIVKPGRMTPKQAIIAGIPEEMLKPYITVNSGKSVLKPINEKHVKEIFTMQDA